MTDGKGIPLAIVISGANTHDVKLLAATLDGIIIERPDEDQHKQNLCLDAGYVGETAKREVEKKGYVPHIRPRGEEIEEKEKNPDFKARRWVVEVCHAWFNRFRKLLVHLEKWIRAISACSYWLLLLSFYVKSSDKIKAILFMDKF